MQIGSFICPLNNKMKWICFVLLICGISPEKIESFQDDVLWRLPDVAFPISYDITLIFTKESLEDPKNNNYKGEVIITYQKTALYNGSLFLHFDPNFLNINNASLMKPDKTGIDLIPLGNPSQIAEFKLDDNEIAPLRIEYNAKLSTSDKLGLYSSTYNNGTSLNTIFATQFKPIYARRVFPCFDEPKYRAVFNMKIIMPDSSRNVLFNTGKKARVSEPNERIYEFKVTPKLSTYSLAFVLTEFEGDHTNNKDFNVYTQSSLSMYNKWAQVIGSEALYLMNFYIDLTLVDKIDVVAIPDSRDNMGGLGLMSAGEVDLLLDAESSSKVVQEKVVSVIAHQIAEIWFGNSLTADWWSNLFLNEGFAMFFEYYIRDSLFRAVDRSTSYLNDQIWEQFVLDVLHIALREDSLETSKPLVEAVNTPEEINAKFNSITYKKGASLLRMIQFIFGKEVFRKGVQSYLGERSDNGTANPKDLWEALSGVSKEIPNLSLMMESYMNNPGYPVVNVLASGDFYILTQEPFLITEERVNNTWTIPITYTTSPSTNFSSSIQWFFAEAPNIAIPKIPDEWIILNVHRTDYYRVNYDTELWEKLASALRTENFDGITEINRAQIVDDLFALADIKRINFTQMFDYIKFLENDVSYFPWNAAFTAFDSILKRVGSESELGMHLTEFILKLMESLYNSEKTDRINDIVHTKNRVQAYSWACKLDNENCKQFAEEQYFNGSIDNDLRTTIYCTVLRNSKNDTTWNELWDKYKSSVLESQQLEILSILGCSNNETILWNYLSFTLYDDLQIRKQHIPNVFKSVYANGPLGVNCSYEFLKQNTQKLEAIISIEDLLRSISGYFNTKEQLQDLENFVNQTEHLTDAAIQIAKKNIQFIEEYGESLIDFFKSEDINETTTTEATGGAISKFSTEIFTCFILLTAFSMYV